MSDSRSRRENKGSPQPQIPSAQVTPEQLRIQQLERTLKLTREELQNTIAQLRRSNERLQASNNEVRSANEELEASGQSLQVLNARLNLVNVRLEEKVAELARAQEIAHLGSWELDLVQNRLTWSDEVYRIFGLDPQEFKASYEAFLDRVHPEDRAAVDAAYSDSLKQRKEVYEINHRVLRTKTGEVRWVHEKCRHVRDEAGRIVRSVGMVLDITDRMKAEESLARERQELKIIPRCFSSATPMRWREVPRHSGS